METQELKATDLMVGDWVSTGYTMSKVISIHTRASSIYKRGVVDLEDIDNIQVSGLQPIPITPEILEKNGFELDADGFSIYYSWEFLKNGQVTMKKDIDGDYELHITDRDSICKVRIYINYVHELQHALRLYRIDKEIEI